MSHSTEIVGNENYPQITKTMLQQGKDPKDMLIEVCRPSCQHWEDKLKRCEAKLKAMTHADPEASCMYPLRDWVTCVDGCLITWQALAGALDDTAKDSDFPYNCLAADRVNSCGNGNFPVCGWYNSQLVICNGYPCAGDYGSGCIACTDPKVQYITSGSCPKIK